MADHPGRRALPGLFVWNRGDQHRSRPSAGGGGGRGPGGEAAPRPAEHPVSRARPAAPRTAPWAPARRSVAGFPVQLGRRGGGGVGQAGAGRHGTPGDPRVPLRLSRPDRPDHGPDDRQGRLPRGVRAAPRIHLPHGLPVLLSRARWGPLPGRLHLRLGSPAGSHLPPVHLPGPRGGRDHRAGPWRRRLHRSAAGLPAAAPRDHPPARDPAHRR